MEDRNEQKYLRGWIYEEKNTLVKESAGSHTNNFGIVGLEAPRSRFELVEGVLRGQADGPHNGDVGLELGPTELVPEALHQLLQPGCRVNRREGPH